MEIINWLDSIDKQLMLLFNYDGGNTVDTFWYYFSYKWTWIPAAIALIWMLYRTRHTNMDFVTDIIMIVLLIAACDQVSSHLIKPLVCRPRPSHAEDLEGMIHLVNNYRGGKYGFVSSHAANAWGLVLYMWARCRLNLMRTVIILWTLLICYSRIYLGVHYPGDIMGGTLVGVSVGAVFTMLVYPIIQRRVALAGIPAERPRMMWRQSAIAIATLSVTMAYLIGYAMIQ